MHSGQRQIKLAGMAVFAVMLLLLMPALLASYNDTVNVQVADQLDRPVENASVYVTYQRDSVKGLITTSPRLTDSGGFVNFTLINTEFVEGVTDRNIVVRVLYGYKGAVLELVANQHPNLNVVPLELYRLTVQVLDQRKSPLAGTVMVGNVTMQTGANGVVSLLVPPGDTVIVVSYSNGQAVLTATVKGDTKEELQFEVYDPVVRLLDDNGEQLQGYVTLRDQSLQTNEAGVIAFKDYVGSSAIFTAQANGHTVVARKDLALSENVIIFLDLHPPVISDVSVQRSSDRLVKLRAYVSDPGIYASGMGELSNVYIDYKAGPRTGRETMYLVGPGAYESEFDSGIVNSIDYAVYAIDNSGNQNFVAGSAFLVPLNTTGNATGGQPGESSQSFFGIAWQVLIGAAVLLGIIAIAAYLYLTRERF